MQRLERVHEAGEARTQRLIRQDLVRKRRLTTKFWRIQCIQHGQLWRRRTVGHIRVPVLIHIFGFTPIL